MFDKPPQSPQEVHTQWVAYGKAKDLEGLLSLYEPDGVIWDMDNDLYLTTNEQRGHFLGGWLDIVEDFDLKTVSLTAKGDGDIVLLLSSWWAQMQRADGHRFRVEHGGAEIVRRQADGSWKFIIDNPYAAHFRPELFA